MNNGLLHCLRRGPLAMSPSNSAESIIHLCRNSREFAECVERCEVAGMQRTQVCENFATKLSIPIVFHSPTAPCPFPFPRDSHGKMGFPNSHLYCRPLESEHVKAVQGEKFREKARFKVV